MILENGEKAKKKKSSARYRCGIGIVIIMYCRGTEEVNVKKVPAFVKKGNTVQVVYRQVICWSTGL